MGLTSGTVASYTLSGQNMRESLSDIIYDISPTSTVFLSSIGRESEDKNTYTEWLTEKLAAAATNAALEGEDAPANSTHTVTHRVGNYHQILTKTIEVSGTAAKINPAGGKQLARELSVKSRELKRDLEFALVNDQVGVVGNSSTARKMAGLGSWLITNCYWAAAATGTETKPTMSSTNDGYPQTAAVDPATLGQFVEADLVTMVNGLWQAGADIEGSFLMVDGVTKHYFSQFPGIATRFKEIPKGQMATIVGASGLYVSEHGEFSVVANLFQSTTAPRGYMVDPAMVSVTYVRPFFTKDLAETGDAIKKQMLVECTLKVRNEAGMAQMRGLLTQ